MRKTQGMMIENELGVHKLAKYAVQRAALSVEFFFCSLSLDRIHHCLALPYMMHNEY